jgi:TldD protein
MAAETPQQTLDRESLAIGVRALVNGYWGFAASPLWTDEDAVRLAREATAQAKANALGPAQTVDLGTIPVASGSWTMPVTIDPFTVPFEERMDFVQSWYDRATDYSQRVFSVLASAAFVRQGRAVATSEGAYFSQTLYESVCDCRFRVKHPDWRYKVRQSAQAHGMQWSGQGWELLLNANPHAQIPRMFEEADELLRAPEKPVEIGRFDVVFPASIVASLVDQTIGMATELDRALGYEANASGTSYLNRPLKMLGSYKAGSSLITVTGNRNTPGGLATVRWDDEGVIPNEMTLVRDGIVTDFQTTREQATWLAPWYQQQRQPVQSHGCAGSATALDVTIQRPPNLALQPGESSINMEDLVANTKRGILVLQSQVYTDFQGRTGLGGGFPLLLREIVNGKPGAILLGANFMFNTSQLWNDVIALGGPSSARNYGMLRKKGQPEQSIRHSVSAVPIAVKEVAIFDNTRKA